ncbi:hypothetical protein EGW08_000235 [Elysia chlorotica]|uniref:TIL domain-containing protein n=1 Tax=Elysia chlorotica TaxID=188477 RepID=A0A3S1A2A0_ELYCH|nr:hypothetical protein EGW08_000235 [Elysia chlorotica]
MSGGGVSGFTLITPAAVLTVFLLFTLLVSPAFSAPTTDTGSDDRASQLMAECMAEREVVCSHVCSAEQNPDCLVRLERHCQCEVPCRLTACGGRCVSELGQICQPLA